MTSVPVFTCPKCGAVCDVTYKPAITKEWCDRVLADFEENKTRKPKEQRASYTYPFEAFAGPVPERLQLTCPRCRWWNVRPTLDEEVQP